MARTCIVTTNTEDDTQIVLAARSAVKHQHHKVNRSTTELKKVVNSKDLEKKSMLVEGKKVDAQLQSIEFRIQQKQKRQKENLNSIITRLEQTSDVYATR